MNFFFKRKKKENEPTGCVSNETRRVYYTAEFNAFGDMTKDGLMNIEEFYRLMMLMAFPKGRDGAKKLWKSQGKSEGAQMSREEYIKMMFDNKIDAKTNTWRKLFAEFDSDGSGCASKVEVVQGLTKLGVAASPKTVALVDKMDTDKDGRISYTEFLKQQLKQG